MNRLIRSFWRQLAMAVLVVLPPMVLMVFGVVWLIHSKWFLPAFVSMLIAGVIVAALGHSVRRSAVNPKVDSQPADPAWAPAEEKVWEDVQSIGKRVQSEPPQDYDGIKSLAVEVVQKVAVNYHGGSDVSWMRFTVPELLLATEKAAKELRESATKRVPGVESVSLADVMVLYRFYARHKAKGQVVWLLYRLLRLVSAPQVAVVQEAKDWASGKGLNAALTVLLGWLARLFAEELGRAAINLYSGRYRLEVAEARKRLDQKAPDAEGPVPVRILIAGQVNAGKSSLTNALIGSVKSAVSELPTPGGIREFRSEPNKEFDLVVLDTPGLTAVGGNRQLLIDACQKVDLIIWLTQANNPARAVDVETLHEIRDWFQANPSVKPPPMMLAMSHIDKISPAMEWSPPYDIVQGRTAKASNIRLALEAVGETLGFADQPMIPVALRANEEPYNLDALWASIAHNLNDAQMTALDRELKKGTGFHPLREFKRIFAGGTFLVGKLSKDRLG